MIFSSIQYLLFLPVVLFLYWRTTGGARLTLVVAASYFFYMSWLPIYGILLFSLTCLNWLLGLAIEEARGKSRLRQKMFLTAGLLMNVGCLCYYKYANFLLANLKASLKHITGIFSFSGAAIPVWEAPVLNILLPLGISFFVFEFIHYTVDVYRGDKAIRSWLEFAAFAAFFPSQIAGPIKRYQEFIPSLRTPEPWSKSLCIEGLTLIVRGLFKKIAIADPLSVLVFDGYAATHALSCADALIISIGFTIQVFCDFSGYTDLGRGSALLMGIRLPENFRLPYLSRDLIAYRRTWHMSLGMWFKDYVYVPLSGSRGGRVATWRNLFLTMTISGLWHGAAWHFVLWGALHGVGLIINREWRDLVSSVKALQTVSNTWVAQLTASAVTMAFITAVMVIFRAPDMEHAMAVLTGVLNFSQQSDLVFPLIKSGVMYFLGAYMVGWALSEALHKANFALPGVWTARDGFVLPVRLASVTAALLLMIAARPEQACPFVYFQF